MLHRTFLSFIIAVIALLLVTQSVSMVHQGQKGVLLRFGTVVETGLTPGLHFKLPFLEQLVPLDDHWITLDSEQQNGGRVKFTTLDGKTLEIDYLAIWHITDMAAFCRVSACDESVGARRINDELIPLLRQLFAAHAFNEMLADMDGRLLAGVPAAVNTRIKELGAQLDSVQITVLTLPSDSLDAVYARMRSAQLEQAAQVRNDGTAAAASIRAAAEQQKAQILAQTDSQVQKIRGAAQAAAAEIYARAYRQDPGFFRFYRSLETYRRVIKSGNSVIVLGPDSEFLKYINNYKSGGPVRH